MPLMTVRCSRHWPPRAPLLGSSGSIVAHARSVNSPRPTISLPLDSLLRETSVAHRDRFVRQNLVAARLPPIRHSAGPNGCTGRQSMVHSRHVDLSVRRRVGWWRGAGSDGRKELPWATDNVKGGEGWAVPAGAGSGGE